MYGAGLICNANDIELHNCHIDVELRHHHTDICHYHRDIEQRHYHAYIQLRKYHRKITLFIYHIPFKTRHLCIHKHKKHSYSLTQQFYSNTFTHAKIRCIPWTVIATFFKGFHIQGLYFGLSCFRSSVANTLPHMNSVHTQDIWTCIDLCWRR